MKKIIILCSLFSLFTLSQSAIALSFGKIQIYSSFAQPFKAEINIPSFSPEELKKTQIKLASEQEFSKRGIDRPEILKNFKFQLFQKNSKEVTLHVVSKQPVKELSMGLLIHVSTPQGSLIKEYNILLTPELISQTGDKSIIAEALKQNSNISIVEAIVFLVTKRTEDSALQILSLNEIIYNFQKEWKVLTNSSTENNDLPLLQANVETLTVTREEIESRKLEIDNLREIASELDQQNSSLRDQIMIMEEDLLLSTQNLFNDAPNKEVQQDNDLLTPPMQEDLSTANSSFSLESLTSDQQQKEMLIAALVVLILLLVILKKKDLILQKFKVRKNRKANAEAEI